MLFRSYWIRFSGKTGTRKCPITEEVYTEIRGFKKDNDKEQDQLFKPSFRTNCSPQLRKSCEIRGIEPFTVYGLRRLRVDTLQRQGIETAVYERIMGHSIRMAQEIYRTNYLIHHYSAPIQKNLLGFHLWSILMQRLKV